MKKELIVSAIIVLVGTAMPKVSAADNSTSETIVMQKDIKYQEIKVEELPSSINEVIKRAFKDSTILKAYTGDDNSYKLIVKDGDETLIVYLDEKGRITKTKPVKS